MLRSTTQYSYLLAAVAAIIPSLSAQSILSHAGSASTIRILYSDQAVFEAGEPRKDLPCDVVKGRALLGFDLRYHASYEATVPLRELAGTENLLTILFRVTPIEPAGEATYFAQRIKVPSIEEDARGDAYLTGAFDLGEGKYKVDWLMRDRAERVCASSWDVEAALAQRDKDVALAIEPGAVRPSDREQFREEPPVVRAADETPLNVKVLVNFAPQNSSSAALQPLDTSALISILRNISRDPRIGRFSLVAFNLQEQRVLYRQDNAERIDFPALGEAIESLKLGTIDVKKLANKHGDTEFLAELIRTEAVAQPTEAPDALVFAGPKAMLDENLPAESLRSMELAYPVFYMNYNLNPQAVPWNDTISKAVKVMKGYEYTISKPRDLWFAVTEMVAKIVKTKQGRRSGTSSSE